MDENRVLVPPEVYDGLESLDESDDLHPDDHEKTKQVASERGFDATVKWIEKVGDQVYHQAALGGYETETKD